MLRQNSLGYRTSSVKKAVRQVRNRGQMEEPVKREKSLFVLTESQDISTQLVEPQLPSEIGPLFS